MFTFFYGRLFHFSCFLPLAARRGGGHREMILVVFLQRAHQITQFLRLYVEFLFDFARVGVLVLHVHGVLEDDAVQMQRPFP